MPSHIAATLGPRPGNTLKPPPNNFYLTKWTPLNERSQLLTESSKTAQFKFFSVENQVDQEPEVIAGIDLNEIIKKPVEKVGGSATGSPSKIVASGSPSKTAPVSPTKVTVSFVGSASAAPSPQKVVAPSGSASPPKPITPSVVSPQKLAQSPKDQVMHPASPPKQISPKKF
jgi:hypothetical protein